ncbi:MAG: NAD(P)-binding domain-containing protein [Eubacterium sp.]|nr:NAD(P)-binding domain-containing protein [Candidatus Colimonas fimequi]
MMKVCVLGTGAMATGIIQVMAQNGHEVIVRGRSQEKAEGAIAKISKGMDRLVAKEKITQEVKDATIAAMTPTADLNAAADADLVIEAIAEDMEVKKDMFRQLDAICKSDAILATNTSALSLTEIAVVTARPDKVIGMHFFNPATVMKLVEVVSGPLVSEETKTAMVEIVNGIGKTPVEVNEAPGFVVNRILIPMINEAICCLEDGVASAEGIDTAMKLGANHPMGPLALGDLIGLDVLLAIMETLQREYGNNKYAPSLLLRQMVRAGKLGRKSGEGFFKY